jgi:hypothetical protein
MPVRTLIFISRQQYWFVPLEHALTVSILDLGFHRLLSTPSETFISAWLGIAFAFMR